MAEQSDASLPDVPTDPKDLDPCRLWIGNLDPKLTEFALMKLLQKFGSLKSYDFLYHKTGPDIGKTRGYCFVTFTTKEEADKARRALHGKKALSKTLIVKPAHGQRQDESDKSQPSTVSSSTSGISKSTQIAAIEAKLRLMEQNSDTDSFTRAPAPSETNYGTSGTSGTSSSTQQMSRLARVALSNGELPRPKYRYNNYTQQRQTKPYMRR